MGISMRYSCRCGFATPLLDSAQHHADQYDHSVDIFGSITSRVERVERRTEDEKVAERFRNAEILREARKRGIRL